MAKPTKVRVKTGELQRRVDRVGEMLGIIENGYSDIASSIETLCSETWVDADSVALMKLLEKDKAICNAALDSFKQFYQGCLSSAPPSYVALEDTITEMVKQLMTASAR